MSATGVVVSAARREVRWEVAPLLVRLLLGAVILFALSGAALIGAADAAVDWTGYETADVIVTWSRPWSG